MVVLKMIMLTCVLRYMLRNPKKTTLYWKTQYFNFLEVDYMNFNAYIYIMSSLTCVLDDTI